MNVKKQHKYNTFNENNNIEVLNTQAETPKEEVWSPLIPIPKDVKDPISFLHFKHGDPIVVYPYMNVDNERLCYICRFEFPNKKKSFAPLSYCENQG